MFCCGATASRTAPLNTQTVEHGHNPVVYSQYTQTLGNATLIEVRGGGIYIRDNFTPYSNDFETPGRTDQATGVSSVNGQNASKQFHNRTTIDAAIAHSTSGFGPGSHDFKTGVQTAFANQRTVQARIGGVSYTDLSGAPYRATYNEPQATGGRIRSWGAYLQDTWTLNDRATLNLGLRYDAIDGDVPELSSDAEIEGTDGSSFSPPVVTYPGVPDLVSYNTIAPRVGFTFRLDQSGRTVLKSAYGRFYGKLVTGMFSGISPGGAVTVVREYSATTGDYTIPVSVTDPKLNFAVDSGLDNQYTDQVSVGIERQIAGGAGIAVSFVYKNEADFVRLQDTRGAYAPRDIVDTFDGVSQTITVQSLTSGVGSPLYTVVNRGDLDQSFKSVVVEFNKRFSDRVQANTSYTWQDSKAFGSGSVTGSTQQDFSSLSPTGRLRPRPERHAQRLRTHGDQRRACRQAVGDVSAAVGLPARRALLLRGRTTLRTPDHRPQHGRRPGRRHHPGQHPRLLRAAGGQRLPDPRRQGLPLRRQPAAPLVRRVQHLQHRHGADAAQQQLAGDGDHAVAADAVGGAAAHGAARLPLRVLVRRGAPVTARFADTPRRRRRSSSAPARRRRRPAAG